MISSELMESGTVVLIGERKVRAVTQPGSAPGSRQQRRKERTRAALVRAAQALLAAGKTDVPIVEITQAADVGMGSFYNHFDSKDQLFQAAVEDALDAHGALLEQLTAGLDDPAEVFACQLPAHRPAAPPPSPSSARSCCTTPSPSPARTKDSPPEPAATSTPPPGQAGSPSMTRNSLWPSSRAPRCASGQLLHDQPDRDDAHATDQVTEDLLRMLGVPAAEAHRICLRPLPDPRRSGGPRTPIVGPRPSVPTSLGEAHRTA